MKFKARNKATLEPNFLLGERKIKKTNFIKLVTCSALTIVPFINMIPTSSLAGDVLVSMSSTITDPNITSLSFTSSCTFSSKCAATVNIKSVTNSISPSVFSVNIANDLSGSLSFSNDTSSKAIVLTDVGDIDHGLYLLSFSNISATNLSLGSATASSKQYIARIDLGYLTTLNINSGDVLTAFNSTPTSIVMSNLGLNQSTLNIGSSSSSSKNISLNANIVNQSSSSGVGIVNIYGYNNSITGDVGSVKSIYSLTVANPFYLVMDSSTAVANKITGNVDLKSDLRLNNNSNLVINGWLNTDGLVVLNQNSSLEVDQGITLTSATANNIALSADSTLTVKGGLVTNSGTVTLTSGSTLNLYGSYTASILGSVSDSGVLNLYNNASDDAKIITSGDIGGTSKTLHLINITDSTVVDATKNSNAISASSLVLGKNASLSMSAALTTTSITLGSGSTLTVPEFTGDIDGAGTLVFANTKTATLASNIGSSTPLSLLTIDPSIILNASDTSFVIKATNMYIGNGSTLKLSATGFNGSVGTLEMADNSSVAGNITSDANITKIQIDDSANVAMSGTVYASSISLGSDSILTINDNVTGTIDGNGSTEGTLVFANNATINNDIGQSYQLSEIKVNDSYTASLNANASATTLTLGAISGSGAIYEIASNSYSSAFLNITANNDSSSVILDGKTANLVINDGGNLAASVTGGGVVSFSGAATVTKDLGSKTDYIFRVESNASSGKTLVINSALRTTSLDIKNAGTVRLLEDSNANVLFSGGGELRLEGINLIGNITASTNGNGTIRVVDSSKIDGNIGDPTGNRVGSIVVSDNKSLTITGYAYINSLVLGSGATAYSTSSSIDTNSITIGTDSVLTLNGSYGGSIDGEGSLVISSSQSTGGEIGGSTPLSQVTIDNSASVIGANNIHAASIIIASSSSLTMTDGEFLEGNITLGSNSGLTIGTGGYLGTINGLSSNYGTVDFYSSQTTGGDIGNSAKISSVKIDSGAVLTQQNNIKADNIIISGQLDQNSGTLGYDETTRIKISNSGIYNFNGGAINGSIDGNSGNYGVLNINSNFSSNQSIGTSNPLVEINIAKAATFNLNDNASASTFNNYGTFAFTTSGRTVTGDIVSTGLLDLGSATTNVSGSLDISGSIGVTLASETVYGNLTSTKAANISEATAIRIYVPSTSFFHNGDKYPIIISNTEGNINITKNSDIYINGTKTNKIGSYSLSTSKSDSKLYIEIASNDISGGSGGSGGGGTTTILSSSIAQNIFSNINSIDAPSSGLLTVQNYINDNTVSSASKNSALLSLAPQPQLAQGIINVASSSIKTAEVRIMSLRSSENSFANLAGNNRTVNRNNDHEDISTDVITPAYNNRRRVKDNGFASGDAIDRGYGTWVQAFGTSATGSSNVAVSGYNNRTGGLSVGFDDKLYDDFLVGLSFSGAQSSIKTKDKLKDTTVNSYQFNAYSAANLGPYFIDTMLGFAWNEYSSSRNIPLVNQIANSNYNGQTYIANLIAGYKKDIGYGFDITPSASLTYSYNNIGKQNEFGAGSLDLNTRAQHSSYMQGKIGTELSYNYMLDNYSKLVPDLKLYYGHDMISTKQRTISSFSGQAATFTSDPSKQSPNVYDIGLGLNLYRSDGITLSSDYNYEYRSDYHSNYIVARFKYEF